MKITRRELLILGLGTVVLPGCVDVMSSSGRVVSVWGRRGLSDGRLQKPRAMAIDEQDHLYIVDMTARIQVFTTEGEFLRGWQTPESKNGRPCGLSFDGDGNLLVADTHYYRMLVYTPQGKLLEENTIGGTPGHEPGQFGFVTDAVQDSNGNYFVAEYGDFDRIQQFNSVGQFISEWGGHGEEPGKFMRPQGLAIDNQDQLWVADACNHRIQVFDTRGKRPKLVNVWGTEGRDLGQMRYPYDLVLDGKGHVYICEFGNHRVQKFTLDGLPIAAFGTSGRGEGEFHQPWACVQDSRGRIHVLDTYNHRVQTILL